MSSDAAVDDSTLFGEILRLLSEENSRLKNELVHAENEESLIKRRINLAREELDKSRELLDAALEEAQQPGPTVRARKSNTSMKAELLEISSQSTSKYSDTSSLNTPRKKKQTPSRSIDPLVKTEKSEQSIVERNPPTTIEEAPSKFSGSTPAFQPRFERIANTYGEYRRMRSAGLELMGTDTAPSRSEKSHPIWLQPRDQPGLYGRIEHVDRLLNHGGFMASSALFIADNDLGGFVSQIASGFGLVEPVIRFNADASSYARSFGGLVPVFVSRSKGPDRGWFYEGTFHCEVLFRISSDLWSNPAMESARRSVVSRMAHTLHPPFSKEGDETIEKVRKFLQYNVVACIGYRLVEWDQHLYDTLFMMGGA